MTKDDNGEGKGFMPSAFLLGAVLLVLLAGMILRTSPVTVLSAGSGAASPAPSLPLGQAVRPELPPAAAVETDPPPVSEPASGPLTAPILAPVSEAIVDPLIAKLAARAQADCGRLAKARGRYTAQLLVACKPETVERTLGMAGGASGLYVLPVQVKTDACFRVCFGSYATAADAVKAADLPKALRGKEKIGAVEIAKVLP